MTLICPKIFIPPSHVLLYMYTGKNAEKYAGKQGKLWRHLSLPLIGNSSPDNWPWEGVQWVVM